MPQLRLYVRNIGLHMKASNLNIQVAQLWQRDRAKLDTFTINVQRYSQNHAQY